jgi:hypothetical protein
MDRNPSLPYARRSRIALRELVAPWQAPGFLGPSGPRPRPGENPGLLPWTPRLCGGLPPPTTPTRFNGGRGRVGGTSGLARPPACLRQDGGGRDTVWSGWVGCEHIPPPFPFGTVLWATVRQAHRIAQSLRRNRFGLESDRPEQRRRAYFWANSANFRASTSSARPAG